MRLIDADKLFCDSVKVFSQVSNRSDDAFLSASIDVALHHWTALIAIAPEVDAEPVRHGKWMKNGGNKYPIYKCSECGYDNQFIETQYCPHCGAKMEKDM